MKWANVGLNLVLEFCLGNQHTGNESAQRKAQPRQLSQPA